MLLVGVLIVAKLSVELVQRVLVVTDGGMSILGSVHANRNLLILLSENVLHSVNTIVVILKVGS